ncbi:AB hydrolase-1 domain-containing protein [Fusarium sp. LHS14.1]|nr:AB hydrolase-1 domain-containing protein [Fusarium sp. LHS14.1]
MKLSTNLLFAHAAWGTASLAQQIPPAVPFSTDFNSSFALNPAQIKDAGLSETIASSINAIINFDRSNLANGGPRQDDFYTLPPKKANLRPGQVLKVQEVTDPAPFNIASGSSLSRILYTTQDINGTVIPASAYILWPFTPRQFAGEPKDKAPAVLWAHGTSGYFADAGPSSFRTLLYDDKMPNHLVQAGYAVVAPDYAGLGLEKSWDESTIPHQYFAMPAAGQDTLYAMEAALEAFGERLSGKFAVAGHSQGGGAAWSAAELLASGKKNAFKNLIKGYVGTISFAPITETLPSAGFASIVSMRVSSILPDFTLDQWLQPLAIARTKLLAQIQGGASVFQQLFLTETDDALAKPGWYNSSYHAQAFEKIGNVGLKPFAGPMLVVQGPEDVFVMKGVTDKTVTETCKLYPDNALEYLVVDELGHTPIITAARLTWMNWLEERFTGKKLDGCKRTTVAGWLGKGKHFTGSNSYSQWAGAPEYRYQNAGSV